ncbi:MAG: acetate kinase [Ramlibacter sp.]|nr:acetate kinase [Ramlibacter sp.]
MRTVPALRFGFFFISAVVAADAQSQSQAIPPGSPKPARPPARSGPPPQSDKARIEKLQQLLKEQGEVLDNLRKAVGEQDARYRELERVVEESRQGQLTQQALQKQQLEQMQQAQQNAQGRSSRGALASNNPDAERPVQVGIAPANPPDPARGIAPIFDQPGVLTPKGQTVIEPSVQYGYSSTNRVALVGYTVVPALLIGLVDVREVKRNTTTAAVAVRYGLTNRFEVEGKLPYVYRSDTTVSREIFTGTATDSVFASNGKGLGDVEVTARYQLTDGDVNRPYLIGSLRFKSRTGRDPFEVVTDCVTRCTGNTTGTGQPLDLATGSGFYTLQPGLTWLYPTDPAVFFGSFTYAYNMKRSGVSRHVLNGESEFIGDIKAGDVLGMNVGMGLSLNDRSSFSIGVDLSSIGRTKQNGIAVPGSVRTQLATLLLGYSHRYKENRTVSISVGAGLTRDTPDLTINLRLPFNL